jgi:hypothetical protein
MVTALITIVISFSDLHHGQRATQNPTWEIEGARGEDSASNYAGSENDSLH